MRLSARAANIEYLKEALNTAMGTNLPKFHVSIFQAFMKADADNFVKLSAAFPEEAALFNRWKQFGMDVSGSEIVAP